MNNSVLLAMAVYDLKDSGRTELTDRTLHSLLETVDFNRHKLTIVDNASCEETHAIFKKFSLAFTKKFTPSNLTILFNEENYGTAKAINKAWVTRAPGQHCIKIDNDVIIRSPGWVDELAEVIQREPKVGIVGLKRKDLIECTNHLDPNFRSQLVQLNHAPGERWVIVEQAKGIMGTCQLVNSALIDKIGYLFQPTTYGFDDSFYSCRSELAGFYNCFLPHIEIDHIDPGGTKYTEWKAVHAGETMMKAHVIMTEYLHGIRPIFEPA